MKAHLPASAGFVAPDRPTVAVPLQGSIGLPMGAAVGDQAQALGQGLKLDIQRVHTDLGAFGRQPKKPWRCSKKLMDS